MENTWEEPIESNIDAKFLEHFNSQIKPKLVEIEKKKNKLSFKVGCATILAIPAFWFLLNSQDKKNVPVELIAFLIFFLCCCLIIYYLGYYKSIVIDELKEPIFSYFDDFLYMKKFKRDRKRRIEYWRHIKMMPEFDLPPIVDDYIIGTYKDVSIEIEELSLRRRGCSNHYDAVVVFNGLILTLPQLKMVTTPLIIRDILCGGTRNQGQDV